MYHKCYVRIFLELKRGNGMEIIYIKPEKFITSFLVVSLSNAPVMFSKTVSSCFSKLHQINRDKESFDKGTFKLLITSLDFSKMLYCSTVWSNTSTQNINKLQSIQNIACKTA